jgi:DNA-binding beta-propeller fold protein YncE
LYFLAIAHKIAPIQTGQAVLSQATARVAETGKEPITRTMVSAMRTTTNLWLSAMCTLLLLLLTTAGAAAQNVLTKIPIPASSADGQIVVNKVLNRVYVSAGFSSGGTLTVIDGKTLTVLTTISNSNGVSWDVKNDNFWTGNLTGGQVLTYSGSTNTQISANTVTFCPGETAFDCKKRRFWVGAQCGAGNDPLFVFNADTFALIAGPIATGGTMGPIVVNPLNGKLHVQSGGVSKQVNPTTFAVTSTGLGTVLAADQHKSKLFATSGNNLQIINAATNKIEYTIPLGYTPGSQIAVNNALRHIYLLNPAANKVEVRGITAISSATDVRGQFVATFSLGTGNMPVGVAADAIRGRAYVVVNNSGSYSLWAIEDTTSVKQCDYVNKGNGNGE